MKPSSNFYLALLRNAHSQEALDLELYGYTIGWVPMAKNEVHHYMRQKYSDYSRRGQSNREGRDNRGWRKFARGARWEKK